MPGEWYSQDAGPQRQKRGGQLYADDAACLAFNAFFAWSQTAVWMPSSSLRWQSLPCEHGADPRQAGPGGKLSAHAGPFARMFHRLATRAGALHDASGCMHTCRAGLGRLAALSSMRQTSLDASAGFRGVQCAAPRIVVELMAPSPILLHTDDPAPPPWAGCRCLASPRWDALVVLFFGAVGAHTRGMHACIAP